jgi:glucose 1-dehydrogenase
MEFLGRVALVTGASRGIGRACALELARGGADVVLMDRDHLAEAHAVAAEAHAMGRRSRVVEGSIGDRRRVEESVAETVAELGSLDVLVANAAFSVHKAVLELSEEDFRSSLDVTLLGTFHCAQLAARRMALQERGGAIVAISSVHAAMPYRGSVPYNAAKAAVNSMVRTMANELAERRVRVNAVEPGWTDTPSQYRRYSAEHLREAGARLPLGRLATPAEIAKGVAYLASDRAAYITGAILRIDGGFVFPRPQG